MEKSTEFNSASYDSADYNYEYDTHDLIELDVTGIAVSSVILYIGLCANIWMIWSLCKTWNSNSRVHFFLLPLSVFDILNLCARCGMTIGVSVTYSWKGGHYACIVVMMFVIFCSCLTHLILAFLNVDNVITVACNKSFKLTRILMMLVAVLVSVAVSIPEALLREEHIAGYENGMAICIYRSDWMDFATVYGIVLDVAHVWVPVAIALLFGVIAFCVWCITKGKRQYGKMQDGEREELKTFGRVVALTLVLDIFFLLCWGPETIIKRMLSQRLSVTQAQIQMYRAFHYLTIANSLINPFIYAIYYCVDKKRQQVSPGL